LKSSLKTVDQPGGGPGTAFGEAVARAFAGMVAAPFAACCAAAASRAGVALAAGAGAAGAVSAKIGRAAAASVTAPRRLARRTRTLRRRPGGACSPLSPAGDPAGLRLARGTFMVFLKAPRTRPCQLIMAPTFAQ
jgi:hypothetical protein